MERAPFFLPMRDCPNRCVYCDQRAITGHAGSPEPRDVREALQAIAEPTEVCFFGGSFTCQPLGRQRDYLEAALAAPSPVNFRISTHPLCVDPSILAFLSHFPVRIIELGVSSLEDEVLETCKRGYTGAEVLERLSLVAANPAFIPGAQLMTGLPGQTPSSSLEDLRRLAAVRGVSPMQIRIYPCLVLKGTLLERMYLSGDYTPPGVDESARWAGRMIKYAQEAGFELLRVGLQETVSLSGSVVAGPHHPALGELARSFALALSLVEGSPQGPWLVPTSSRSLLSGHGRWGFRELAALSGMTVERAGGLVRWVP